MQYMLKCAAMINVVEKPSRNKTVKVTKGTCTIDIPTQGYLSKIDQEWAN
jgi:hypothetical protein